ncbi:Gfo/Idh/MocA family protein [Raineyella fluvialis]|uniref:Gfo/Idh/MocA family protein n=1 Tax=Raineyella fluvialis TaxID=2662261 RepID=UPI003BAFE0D3
MKTHWRTHVCSPLRRRHRCGNGRPHPRQRLAPGRDHLRPRRPPARPAHRHLRRVRPFAEDAAKSYGYERAETDWRRIAEADDIDVVSIVVANRLHREIAEALTAAAKHVLCEKPLSDTLEDARAMAELEAAVDVVTGIGFGYRRQPGIAQIARMVQEGDLGTLTQFNGTYWCDYGADPAVPIAWRYKGPMGSGALGDVGSHITDLAEFICGPLVSVSGAQMATIITHRPPAMEGISGGRGATTAAEATEVVENDDIALFSLRFASGAVGTISVSRVAFGCPNNLAFDVLGTGGKVRFDMNRAGEIQVDDTAPRAGLRGPRQVLVGTDFPYFQDGSSMAFGGVGVTQIDQFVYQARAFLDQVAGVDEGLAPVPTFAHGYRAIRIQDAIARCASADGATVAIDF